jgi:hypothetical protein
MSEHNGAMLGIPGSLHDDTDTGIDNLADGATNALGASGVRYQPGQRS